MQKHKASEIDKHSSGSLDLKKNSLNTKGMELMSSINSNQRTIDGTKKKKSALKAKNASS